MNAEPCLKRPDRPCQLRCCGRTSGDIARCTLACEQSKKSEGASLAGRIPFKLLLYACRWSGFS